MQTTTAIADALDRVRIILHNNLADLTAGELVKEPHPPIGWLAWHIARVQDTNISALQGNEQVWVDEGWHKEFGMPVDPRDYSPGHVQTPEIVGAFRAPDAQTILDYHDAVRVRTLAYLETLSETDLDRVLDEPRFNPLPTVGVRLVSVCEDNLQHAGQLAYLKGLMREGGWYPNRPQTK
jgi:hypothetical protein